MTDAKNGHYGIACASYFVATHPTADENSVNINHPNQYFEDSQKLLRGGKLDGKLYPYHSKLIGMT